MTFQYICFFKLKKQKIKGHLALPLKICPEVVTVLSTNKTSLGIKVSLSHLCFAFACTVEVILLS
jgi:hypothetical protein